MAINPRGVEAAKEAYNAAVHEWDSHPDAPMASMPKPMEAAITAYVASSQSPQPEQGEVGDIADALDEFSDIDEAEGGNPHVIATERQAATLLRTLSGENEALRRERANLIETKRGQIDAVQAIAVEMQKRAARWMRACMEAREGCNQRSDVIRQWVAKGETLEARLKLAEKVIGAAERRFNSIRGAIESNQVVDKDAHRIAVEGRDAARTFLQTQEADGKPS